MADRSKTGFGRESGRDLRPPRGERQPSLVDDGFGAGPTYVHARSYVPELGRFPHPDPIVAEGNLYGYADTRLREMHFATAWRLDCVASVTTSGWRFIVERNLEAGGSTSWQAKVVRYSGSK